MMLNSQVADGSFDQQALDQQILPPGLHTVALVDDGATHRTDTNIPCGTRRACQLCN